MDEIKKLLQAGDEEGLIKYLSAEEREIRASSARALGQLGRPSSVTALVGAMGDEEVQVRQAAAAALAGIGEQAIPALLETLEGRGGRLAPYALWALGEIGSPAAVDALIDRAKEAPTWRIRWSAVESLGDVGGERACYALVDTLGDRDERVRNAASEALVRIGIPAVPALSDTLHDSRREVRQTVRNTLSRINDPAAQAILRHEQLLFWIPIVLLGAGGLLVVAWLLSVIIF